MTSQEELKNIKEAAEKYLERLQAGNGGKLDEHSLLFNKSFFQIYVSTQEAKEYWYKQFQHEQEIKEDEKFDKHAAEVHALIDKEKNIAE